MINIKFKKLNSTIIKCKKCPRLVKFSKEISIIKRKQNINEVYWGKPVTGFGDVNAKLEVHAPRSLTEVRVVLLFTRPLSQLSKLSRCTVIFFFEVFIVFIYWVTTNRRKEIKKDVANLHYFQNRLIFLSYPILHWSSPRCYPLGFPELFEL